MILVKSAGNGGPGAGTMTSPSDARGVIVVGATSRDGATVSSYSSRGPAAAKPGPDLVAPGGSGAAKDAINCLIPGGTIGPVGEGTSFAAPHISGAMALLLQQNPGATPDELKAKLLANAQALAVNPPEACGAGLLILS